PEQGRQESGHTVCPQVAAQAGCCTAVRLHEDAEFSRRAQDLIMAVNRKSLVWVVIRISIFWWCLFTLVAFGSSPVKIVEYLGLYAYDILRYLYQVVFACAVMVLAIGVGVYAQRMFRLKSLLKHELMGVVST